MSVLLISVFVIAYLAIAFEHPLSVNKSAPALIGAGLLWTIYALSTGDVTEHLNESLSGIAQIIFFLMGAMAIVEVIDAHDGFEVITEQIKTTRMNVLLWTIGLVTFFLSAVLDNLTTTIIMISLTRKLLSNRDDRLFFAGIIVIAANAGGAWSPIGDVTTTMLWIGGQITALGIMESVFIPSAINLLVPLAVISFFLRGKTIEAPVHDTVSAVQGYRTTSLERKFMLFTGVSILCAVPVFKTITHMPPFMGILFGLGILWLIGEIIHRDKNEEDRQRLTLVSALQRIDISALVFFLGILLSVAALEHAHLLTALAEWLDHAVGSQSIIIFILGLLSAVIDNVPLVAAAMGMYSLTDFPSDSFLWEFLAYAAGTGGSILIIGSAAGVAAMSIEKIEFFWYVKKVSLLALLGYTAGALAYVFF